MEETEENSYDKAPPGLEPPAELLSSLSKKRNRGEGEDGPEGKNGEGNRRIQECQEPLESEASETRETETPESETSATLESETVGSETVGSETGESETGESETGESETVGSETVESETVGSETLGSQTLESRDRPEVEDLAGNQGRQEPLGVPESPELDASEPPPPMPEVPHFSSELGQEERVALKRVLMAMLFASTEPLSASRLSEAAGISVAPIKELLQELREDSLKPEAVFELKKHGDGWRLYTKEEFYPYLVRLRSLKKVERLTPAALETLAIIAYRQPVIRAEIEAIRGVKVGPMLRALLDRKLVSIVGRAPVPGAPFQYGTTKTFLERFGLQSLEELPSLAEFQQGRI